MPTQNHRQEIKRRRKEEEIRRRMVEKVDNERR